MAENPDNKHPNTAPHNPSPGDLRFIRIEEQLMLQRWEYSYIDGQWNWYDIPLADG